MSPKDNNEIYAGLGTKIEALVKEYCTQKLNVSSFVEEMLKLERHAIQPAGLTLVATDTSEGWLRFSLHLAGKSEVCAAFECRLDTGEFKQTK